MIMLKLAGNGCTSRRSLTVVERDVVVHSDGRRQAHVRHLGNGAVLQGTRRPGDRERG